MDFAFKMSFFTESTLGFTLKMESVTNNTVFGPKMMVKSGLEKFYFEIPPCGKICDFGHFFEVRESSLLHGGISKTFFRPLFTIILRPKIVILDSDSVLRVKNNV